jgi:Zn-dependent oligopeptidase
VTYDLATATTDSIATATDAAIAMADALAEAATTSRGSTFADRIAPLDAALGIIQDANGYGPFLANFHTDEDVRDAGNAARERLATWASDLVSRRDVYEAVHVVEGTDLTDLERRSHDEWVRDLRRAGHDVSESDRARVQELRHRLIKLEVDYARNIAAYKDHLEVPVSDLGDLPPSYVGALDPGEADGTVRVTLDYPAYVPFMEHSPNRDLRRELQFKYLNRAVSENRPLLEEAIAIRHEIATILGYGDWAEYSMEVKMADPSSVDALYASVIPGLSALGAEEKARLEELLDEDHPGATLEPWDRQYYHTVQQKRDYGIDQQEVAAYFPLDRVIDGMLEVTGEVLGLTYVRLEDHPRWHEDVRVYRIHDASTGQALALFYLDLHPREGKFTHAACWDVVNRKRTADGMVRLPVAAVAANFTKPTPDTPSLLKHDEALTLWHEFGHVLHACLTEIDTQRFAGFDTEWDFVEAPSQIMENWMWSADVLHRFARHYGTGEPIPDEMVESLVAARDQNVGLLTLRQVFLGTYDLAMHTAGPTPDLDALQAEANAYTLLPLHEGTFLPASFGHLMGGYDAGYYGYLWSQVYGDDMYSVFLDEGILSPEVGRRYRNEVLARGSSRDAWEHLRAFLGREPNAEAFLSKLGIE